MKSDLNAITDLIGDLNKESIHAIFGPSQVGKTTLQMQLCYEVSHKTERPVLMYDSVLSDTPIVVQIHGETKIIPIGSLIKGGRNYRSVKKNHIKILSDDGFVNVDYVYVHKVQKTGYRILTRTGYVECTEDHSLVINGKEIKPEDLQVGSKIDQLQYIGLNNVTNIEKFEHPPEDDDMDTELAWALGMYVAEGTQRERYQEKRGTYKYCKMSNKNVELLERCKNAFRKAGLQTKISYEGSGMYRLDAVRGYNVAFFEFIKSHCYEKTTKIVPPIMFRTNEHVIKAFLDGLWAGDGHATGDVKSDRIVTSFIESAGAHNVNGTITLAQIHKSVVAGVTQLLSNMGVKYSVDTRADKPKVLTIRLVSGGNNLSEYNVIREIEAFDIDDYVYDVETENHHFRGGIGNILLHNTEGGLTGFVEKWDKVMKERYPNAQVDVRLKRKYNKILQDHGKLLTMKMSGDKRKSDDAKKNTGGKMQPTLVEDIEPSPMVELMLKKKYSMVFYDSVTMPLKYFGSEQQNFPARSTISNLWYSSMIDIIDECDAYVFASHHSSKNPATPYAREQMAGGSASQFYSKIILFLKQYNQVNPNSYRRLKLVRYFNKAPNEHETLLQITDKGYIDKTQEEIDTELG